MRQFVKQPDQLISELKALIARGTTLREKEQRLKDLQDFIRHYETCDWEIRCDTCDELGECPASLASLAPPTE